MADAESDPWRLSSAPRALMASGVILALVVGISGVFAALTTSYQCDPGTAHLVQAVPAEYQTGYCEAAHFPDFPDSPGSALLVAAIFFLPVVLALSGAALAARARSKTMFRLTGGAAIALAIVPWLLLTQAGINYPGHG
jgi:hypothetical protein